MRYESLVSFPLHSLVAATSDSLQKIDRWLPRGEHIDCESTSIAELVTTMGSHIDRAREAEVLRALLRVHAAAAREIDPTNGSSRCWQPDHSVVAATTGQVAGSAATSAA
jgi:hypothetical protein